MTTPSGRGTRRVDSTRSRSRHGTGRSVLYCIDAFSQYGDVPHPAGVIYPSTHGFACGVIVVAAILSGLVVRRRLDDLDLIAVLKTRE